MEKAGKLTVPSEAGGAKGLPFSRADQPYLRSFLLLLVATAAVWEFVPLEVFVGASRYASLHAILETISVVVAVLVFAIIWYSPDQNRHVVIGACLFMGVALLDMLHFLSYVGMPDLVTPNTPHKAIIFWLFARYLSAFAILFFLLEEKQLEKYLPNKKPALAMVLGFCFAVTYVAIYQPDWVPPTFVPAKGLTAFKVIAEYVLITLYAALGVYIYRLYKRNRESHYFGVLVAVVALCVSEFLFTLYGSVTDIANLTGHIYKVYGYGLIFLALFVSTIRQPYLKLQASELSLKTLSEILSHHGGNTLYRSIGKLLYDVTGAAYVLIVQRDREYTVRPKMLSYYVNGEMQHVANDEFFNGVVRENLYARLIVRSSPAGATDDEKTGQLPAPTFISIPLRTRIHGVVGAIVIGSDRSIPVNKSLQDLLSLSALRLSSEIEQTISRLRKTRQKLELSKRLEQAREQERAILARDIHDDLGGGLAALKIEINLLKRRVGEHGRDPASMIRLDKMSEVVDKSIADMRDIINNLRLGMLDDLGLAETIAWKLKDVESNHNIKTTFCNNVQGENFGLSDASDAASLYRLICEAITNVVKHAQATRLSIYVNQKENLLRISIMDDGKGMDKKKKRGTGSFGLIGMKERAELLGGKLELHSDVNSGTRIDVLIPVSGEVIT